MRVISTPQEFNVADLYVDLRRTAGHRLYLKCEGFNFAGSVKLKAAVELVSAAERAGTLRPGGTLVESSSGGIGVALGLVTASRGYRFVYVTDSRCTLSARQLMQSLGAEVHVVGRPRREDRVRLVRRLCAQNPGYVWLNAGENPANWTAHYESTGPEILRTFPDLDVLFAGAGTGGTLTGCARYLRAERPSARIVAVTWDGTAVPDVSYVDDVVRVTEVEALHACRLLAQRGFVFGASTGIVLSGAMSWLNDNARGAEPTAVAISPDLGDRYLDTVYQDQWVSDSYGADALDAVLTDTRVEVVR